MRLRAIACENDGEMWVAYAVDASVLDSSKNESYVFDDAFDNCAADFETRVIEISLNSADVAAAFDCPVVDGKVE